MDADVARLRNQGEWQELTPIVFQRTAEGKMMVSYISGRNGTKDRWWQWPTTTCCNWGASEVGTWARKGLDKRWGVWCHGSARAWPLEENQRISLAEAGRRLWRSSGPSLLLKQGPQGQLAVSRHQSKGIWGLKFRTAPDGCLWRKIARCWGWGPGNAHWSSAFNMVKWQVIAAQKKSLHTEKGRKQAANIKFHFFFQKGLKKFTAKQEVGKADIS